MVFWLFARANLRRHSKSRVSDQSRAIITVAGSTLSTSCTLSRHKGSLRSNRPKLLDQAVRPNNAARLCRSVDTGHRLRLGNLVGHPWPTATFLGTHQANWGQQVQSTVSSSRICCDFLSHLFGSDYPVSLPIGTPVSPPDTGFPTGAGYRARAPYSCKNCQTTASSPLRTRPQTRVSGVQGEIRTDHSGFSIVLTFDLSPPKTCRAAS
jgi:hypothetical protein